MITNMSLFALKGLPEIREQDDIARIILESLESKQDLQNDDIVVIAQKIVSKAEGRFFHLSEIEPSKRANEIALECDKDPRLVELILSEAEDVVRCVPGVLITRHRLGFVVANSAIDQSNVPGTDDIALLLPVNPDASAKGIHAAIKKISGKDVGVIISDSFGRPWRNGTCGFAIGCAGLESLMDRRGELDREGRELKATIIGHADELAAAASILMGQRDEGQPVVIIRGADRGDLERPAGDLIRPLENDLFR